VAGASAALVAAPNAIFAQLAPLPRVALIEQGDITANMVEGGHPYWSALLSRLRELGYVEGETIAIERWSGRGTTADGFAELSRRIVGTTPDLIVARGRNAIRNTRSATTEIPIVGLGTFPTDLQARLARPGGNTTGISASFGSALYSKMVQILHDAVPTASRFAIFGPREWWARYEKTVQNAAMQLGITLVPVFVEEPVTEATIRSAVGSIAGQEIHAVYISASLDLYTHRDFLAAQIATTRLPAIAFQLEHAAAGQLISYAPDFIGSYRRLATYVDRILKGADPGELPIEQPTEIKLVVNLKTARALGVTLPPAIMIQATEIIE